MDLRDQCRCLRVCVLQIETEAEWKPDRPTLRITMLVGVLKGKYCRFPAELTNLNPDVYKDCQRSMQTQIHTVVVQI